MRRRSVSVLAAAALVLSIAGTAGAGGPWETAQLGAQGAGAGVNPVGTAAVHRTADGVSAKITMTLPAAYSIPSGPTSTGEHGTPEAFTLWAFIFFNPDECTGIEGCDGDDLRNTPAVVAGGFNAGGHVQGGTQLILAGRVTEQSTVFPPGNVDSLSAALSQGFDLDEAEIHLAVAPHGVLDPALLPRQISTPAGDPSVWWIASFDPLLP